MVLSSQELVTALQRDARVLQHLVAKLDERGDGGDARNGEWWRIEHL